MAAEALVQERHHNDVLAQPDHGASTASGLSLLRYFSLQTLRLSPQFRSPSLSLYNLAHGFSLSLQIMLTHHLNFLTF
ncbi:hypothetical protein C1H46_004772 [Malus baccata]|uniref:Uncharacterized protein n=1 Tax=Malus baccata TaxID=106549 RepID=A0A540NG14_MALBA|nr:hypothetical protein C1H46_004772 [Malus baccata]